MHELLQEPITRRSVQLSIIAIERRLSNRNQKNVPLFGALACEAVIPEDAETCHEM